MKVVALFSGGLDSTTLLAHLLSQDHEVFALGVNYGQRHGRELRAARVVAAELDVPFTLVDLPGLAAVLPSALTSGLSDDKVVPNRNAVLVMVAVGYARACGADAVALGVNATDAGDFYDCRPLFLRQLNIVAALNDVELWTPFVGYSKRAVAQLGRKLGAPLDLSWSCYLGGDVPCGSCDACGDRAIALHAPHVVR